MQGQEWQDLLHTEETLYMQRPGGRKRSDERPVGLSTEGKGESSVRTEVDSGWLMEVYRPW